MVHEGASTPELSGPSGRPTARRNTASEADLLADLRQQLGDTSAYVTHDQVEAMALSDLIVILQDRRVEQIGPPTGVDVPDAAEVGLPGVGDEVSVDPSPSSVHVLPR